MTFPLFSYRAFCLPWKHHLTFFSLIRQYQSFGPESSGSFDRGDVFLICAEIEPDFGCSWVVRAAPVYPVTGLGLGVNSYKVLGWRGCRRMLYISFSDRNGDLTNLKIFRKRGKFLKKIWMKVFVCIPRIKIPQKYFEFKTFWGKYVRFCQTRRVNWKLMG